MSHLNVLRGGQGPTLLLLHGIGSSATAWSKQMERLGRYYTCIAPDLPGYGDSPDPAGTGLLSTVYGMWAAAHPPAPVAAPVPAARHHHQVIAEK